MGKTAFNRAGGEYAPEVLPQVCVVAVRLERGELQVCLITSVRKGRWILPKGNIERGETREQSAAREAYEEAGLNGRVLELPIGTYTADKWGSRVHVTGVIMEVGECLADWPEAAVRYRRWVSPQRAAGMLRKGEFKQFVSQAVDRLKVASPAGESKQPIAASETPEFPARGANEV